ncbi:MAG TPA: DUF445 family protein [Gemmatimonadales bacterium]
MDRQTILTGIATVLVGAISGGITNAIAIWMLFRPHEPRRLFFIMFHGAIPKNKPRLARTIGKTVGERLLTPEDVASRLSTPQVREAFAESMTRVIDDLLDREHGSLREMLPSQAAGVAEGIVGDIGPRVADHLARFTETPAFTEMIGRWMERLRRDVGDRPVRDLLTPANREALVTRIDSWMTDAAEGHELEHTLRSWVAHQLEVLAQDPRPLVDRLPAGLLAPVEQAIDDYLPTAIDRVSGLLSDPETRATVSAALRKAFDGAARQLLLHERILAKLVVNEQTFDRLLDGIERNGFERFASAITAPAVRSRLANALHQAFVGLLRMPLGERLARLGPERRAALIQTLGDWLVTAARSPSTRASVQRALERGIDAAGNRTWGEALALVPDERVAALIAEALRGESGQAWVADTVSRSASRLLDLPIGRPADWLGPATAAAVRQGITNGAWSWVQSQVPRVVEKLNVPEMVEQKVLGFSTQRMEEIVRTVTERELKLIVRLGYVLGALVGILAFALNQLL